MSAEAPAYEPPVYLGFDAAVPDEVAVVAYEPPATVTRAQLVAAVAALGIDANEISCLVWDPDFLQLETKAGPRYVRVVP